MRRRSGNDEEILSSEADDNKSYQHVKEGNQWTFKKKSKKDGEEVDIMSNESLHARVNEP